MLIYLQGGITPEQFDGAVEQLSRTSIDLAEAAANFGALKVIFGVFLTLFVVMLLWFLYQLVSMTRKVDYVYGSTQKTTKLFEESANRLLGKPQASILIRRAFNSLSQSIKYTILRTRIENHLDQREFVDSKVTKFITHEYRELVNFLANYTCDGKTLDTHIKVEDAKIITDFVLEQVYLGEDLFSVASMDQASDILAKGLRLEALQGIE